MTGEETLQDFSYYKRAEFIVKVMEYLGAFSISLKHIFCCSWGEHYVSVDYILLIDSSYFVSLRASYEKEGLASVAITMDVFHFVHLPLCALNSIVWCSQWSDTLTISHQFPLTLAMQSAIEDTLYLWTRIWSVLIKVYMRVNGVPCRWRLLTHFPGI